MWFTSMWICNLNHKSWAYLQKATFVLQVFKSEISDIGSTLKLCNFQTIRTLPQVTTSSLQSYKRRTILLQRSSPCSMKSFEKVGPKDELSVGFQTKIRPPVVLAELEIEFELDSVGIWLELLQQKKRWLIGLQLWCRRMMELSCKIQRKSALNVDCQAVCRTLLWYSG